MDGRGHVNNKVFSRWMGGLPCVREHNNTSPVDGVLGVGGVEEGDVGSGHGGGCFVRDSSRQRWSGLREPHLRSMYSVHTVHGCTLTMPSRALAVSRVQRLSGADSTHHLDAHAHAEDAFQQAWAGVGRASSQTAKAVGGRTGRLPLGHAPPGRQSF